VVRSFLVSEKKDEYLSKTIDSNRSTFEDKVVRLYFGEKEYREEYFLKLCNRLKTGRPKSSLSPEMLWFKKIAIIAVMEIVQDQLAREHANGFLVKTQCFFGCKKASVRSRQDRKNKCEIRVCLTCSLTVCTTAYLKHIIREATDMSDFKERITTGYKTYISQVYILNSENFSGKTNPLEHIRRLQETRKIAASDDKLALINIDENIQKQRDQLSKKVLSKSIDGLYTKMLEELKDSTKTLLEVSVGILLELEFEMSELYIQLQKEFPENAKAGGNLDSAESATVLELPRLDIILKCEQQLAQVRYQLKILEFQYRLQERAEDAQDDTAELFGINQELERMMLNHIDLLESKFEIAETGLDLKAKEATLSKIKHELIQVREQLEKQQIQLEVRPRSYSDVSIMSANEDANGTWNFAGRTADGEESG